jgi:hypothetical protein
MLFAVAAGNDLLPGGDTCALFDAPNGRMSITHALP